MSQDKSTATKHKHLQYVYGTKICNKYWKHQKDFGSTEISCNFTKGQLISKCLFGVFNFFQKTNKNKSTWDIILVKSKEKYTLFSKVEFIHSFDFWKNLQLDNLL